MFRKQLWFILLAVSAFLFLSLTSCGGDDDTEETSSDGGSSEDTGKGELSVTAISPSSGPVSGGTAVTIVGNGFTDLASVTFGVNDATDVTVLSEKKINAKTPPANSAGKVTVRVTLKDGNATELKDGFTYTSGGGGGGGGGGEKVNWCILQYPTTTSTAKDVASEQIFGRVFVEGVTQGDGEGADIIGEIGYGPKGTNPENTAWQWNSAAYNLDADGLNPGDKANDEYQGTLTIGESGDFSFAYRFSKDGGTSWLYCDLDGSDNGFDPAQAGVITVTSGDIGTVNWCILKFPSELTVAKGSKTDLIFGQVFHAGKTEGEGQGTGIVGQLGVGPSGSDSSSSGAWAWSDAQYNFDADGMTPGDKANDEYMATLTPETAGVFSYAYRFTLSGSTEWLYCDLDGSDNGLNTTSLGVLTVVEPSGPAPKVASVSPSSGPTTGGTEVTISGTDFATGVVVFFGLSQASDVNVASATQITAKTPPHAAGEVDVTVKNPDTQSGTLTKGFTYKEPATMVDWCNVQFPSEMAGVVNEETSPVYGQVYKAGVTEGQGKGSGIVGQLGVTKHSEAVSPELNPSAWSWGEASYNVDSGNNDEYQKTITPDEAGEFIYAYRFSLDGGQTWRYCDLDGSDNGFSLDATGVLTVTNTPKPSPTISAITPPSGDISGGTTVTITGTDFAQGATVHFGSSPATDVAVGSATEITCKTPAHSPGMVNVSVTNSDGGSATSENGFTYVDTHPKADYAILQFPTSTTTLKDKETELVFGRVYKAGLTDKGGEQTAIKAELGFGADGTNPDGNTGWQWISATFNAEYGNDDEYMAKLTPGTAGTFDYAYRFSLDNGVTWVYADTDGSTNGYLAEKAGALTVVEQAQNPAPVVSSLDPKQGDIAGGTKVTITGQNFVNGATVSFGSTAATDVSVKSATEISATSPAQTKAGKVTVTVKNTDGQSGALDNGFTYTETENLPDWYNLQYPTSTTTTTIVQSEWIFGQVYEGGVTDKVGQAADFSVQLGFGPQGSDPRSSSAWQWQNATYNLDIGNNDEYKARMTITTAGTYSYTYRYSYKSSSYVYADSSGSGDGFDMGKLGTITVVAPAPDWCTLETPVSLTVIKGEATEAIYGQIYEPGVTDGAEQGQGVKAELGYGSDGSTPGAGGWQWVSASFAAKAGTGNHNDRYSATLTINTAGKYDYAYRFSLDNGATWTYCDLDGSNNGYSVSNTGDLTVNAPEALTFTKIEPSSGIEGGGTLVTLTGTAFSGSITVTFGGAPATEVAIVSGTSLTCKTPAHAKGKVDVVVTKGTENATLAQGYTFTGVDATGIEWCNLQHPASTTTTTGTATEDIYGQVLKTGVTEPAGQGVGIIGQLGYGPSGSNPTQNDNGWNWVSATYNVDVGNNDEYKAKITPSASGSFSYVYRFSDDNGASFKYCDKTGSTDGFSADQLGALTVNNP